MRKFECNKCRLSTACTFNGFVKPEQCVVSKLFISDWHEVKEGNTQVAALPDWVQECAVGYDNEQNRYFEVTNIDEKFVDIEYLDDGNGATCDDSDMQKCSEARKRPFYDKEMQKLVGRIFTTAAEDVSIATDFDGQTNALYIRGEWFSRKVLADSAWLLDGKPCYVLEHKNDKGEWVK